MTQAQAKDALAVAVIGVGGFGRWTLQALRASAIVRVVERPSESPLAIKFGKYHIARFPASFLKTNDKPLDIDGIFDANASTREVWQRFLVSAGYRNVVKALGDKLRSRTAFSLPSDIINDLFVGLDMLNNVMHKHMKPRTPRAPRARGGSVGASEAGQSTTATPARSEVDGADVDVEMEDEASRRSLTSEDSSSEDYEDDNIDGWYDDVLPFTSSSSSSAKGNKSPNYPISYSQPARSLKPATTKVRRQKSQEAARVFETDVPEYEPLSYFDDADPSF